MQKYANSVQDTAGNAIVTATVSVYSDAARTTLATLYSDNGVTPTTNPLTTDALGELAFYAADGRYYLSVNKGGIVTQYLDDILLFDPAASTGAAGVGFKQSGTGALTSTVSAALQLHPHSSQFDTAGHFNTAQAALTGSFGVYALRVGAGQGGQIWMPTTLANCDFAIGTTGVTFNGQVDPILGIAYNPNQVNASEPYLGWNMEGHYYDLTTHWMEMNIDFKTAAGVGTRLFGMQVNRANGASNWAFAGSPFRIESVINAGEFIFDTSAKTLSLASGEVLAGTATALGAAGYGGFRANGTAGGFFDLMVNGTRTASFFADSTGTWLQTATATPINLQTNAGALQVVVSHTASAVNNLTLTGGSAAIVTVGAAGSATDIDIAITPKGAGNVKFGTNTAKAAEAFASYITIKDSGGTARKVMVCA